MHWQLYLSSGISYSLGFRWFPLISWSDKWVCSSLNSVFSGLAIENPKCFPLCLCGKRCAFLLLYHFTGTSFRTHTPLLTFQGMKKILKSAARSPCISSTLNFTLNSLRFGNDNQFVQSVVVIYSESGNVLRHFAKILYEISAVLTNIARERSRQGKETRAELGVYQEKRSDSSASYPPHPRLPWNKTHTLWAF